MPIDEMAAPTLTGPFDAGSRCNLHPILSSAAGAVGGNLDSGKGAEKRRGKLFARVVSRIMDLDEDGFPYEKQEDRNV
ncbi:hypothetical protein CORC01_09440 [Colletotrichum orchidophilum]|uniref:Uncharacterized protein n=1 Tax=Colletotrichum orchidophilum TaxID=1209926 RepID=A0A1G4B1U8_9PEZI|nr:uncharacterized protein CORC01_09440 [Colletotrichum orchidophilum]OHE95295.1 hypothetical protein CORC01_09440 [Colletotrichum orchidophilum]